MLKMQLRADDIIRQVRLNGWPIFDDPAPGAAASTTKSGSFRGPPLSITQSTGFQPGQKNCLEVVVEDVNQIITGLNVVATVTYQPVLVGMQFQGGFGQFQGGPVIFNLSMQGGNEKTPCPGLGVVYMRANASSVPYLKILLAALDQQCAAKGPGLKLQSINFLTCSPDPRGVGFGPNASADLTCG